MLILSYIDTAFLPFFNTPLIILCSNLNDAVVCFLTGFKQDIHLRNLFGRFTEFAGSSNLIKWPLGVLQYSYHRMRQEP